MRAIGNPSGSVQLSLDFSVIDPKIAAIAKHSPLAAKRVLLDALEAELGDTNDIDDWVSSCLKPKSSASFDQDEAFISYFHWWQVLGLPVEYRLTHAEFTDALGVRGYRLAEGQSSRPFRVGGQLRNKFGGFSPYCPVAPVSEFVEERCVVGGCSIAERGRSTEIHQDYVAWAELRGGKPLGIVHFSKHLKSLGFSNIRSDGHWWVGLRLRSSGPSNRDGLEV